MSEISKVYDEGYRHALRDAEAAIKMIEDHLRLGKNYRTLEAVLPALALARRSVSTLEPGFLSPASEQPPRS